MIQFLFWMAPWIPLVTYLIFLASLLIVLAVKLTLPNLKLFGLALKKAPIFIRFLIVA